MMSRRWRKIIGDSKLLFRVFVTVCILLFTACSAKPNAYDEHGNPIRLSDYAGKWIVINYWAAWCNPCWQEATELNAFYETHKDQVMVFGVNFDNATDETIHQFTQKTGITFPLLKKFTAQQIDSSDIPTLPATFLISPNRKQVNVLYGPQTQQTLQKMMWPT